ncbi:CarD family transcriptional regulator [Ammoniphilus sp. 3BR4]|uniref:CarD family transcriptional regulator n=1 Tax=Ammoniphilus sp. 3BR4 TaxID=3158265 RepID=UPI003465DE27
MFKAGDKIFYPMHGAGIVQAIEEKEILGEKQLYYILNFSLTSMQIMVPASQRSDSLLRGVADTETLQVALDICHENGSDTTVYQRQQKQRMNIDKMKSGDIYEGAKVIRDLRSLSKNKKLNQADKSMLNHAQQMLISELSLVLGVNQQQASNLVEIPPQ